MHAERPYSSALKKHFDQAASEQLRGLRGYFGQMAYVGYVLDNCAFPLNARVLELGCGDGNTMGEISSLRPDIKLFGQDISENLLARAQEKVPHAKFCLGDVLENIGFEGEFFDVVFSFGFAQYFSAKELISVNRRLMSRLAGGQNIAPLHPRSDQESCLCSGQPTESKGPCYMALRMWCPDCLGEGWEQPIWKIWTLA